MANNWKTILTLCGLWGVAWCSCEVLAGPPSQASRPPNIILILADDLGAKELACYGNKIHKTPNLDRIASEGTRLQTFYANPLCTPTRVTLMTGQYGFRNGFLGMQNPAFKPAPSSSQADIGSHFTHADLLKSRGYKTAMAGKWQLSGKLPTLIHDCGFDEYCMWAYDHNLPDGVKHPAHERPQGNTCRYWHPSIVQNGKYRPTQPNDYGPDLFNEFVIDFAKRNRNEPFFVYYTSVLTHGPHLETPNPKEPGKRWPANFQSNVEYLDHLMGQLDQALQKEGLSNNTHLVFIGDNGTAGDGKGTLTELGARVPCIVKGPGVKSGQVSQALGDLTDIMPTLAEFSGASLPKDRVFDGKSLVPVLRGEQSRHREWIYSHLDDGRILRDAHWLLEVDKGGKGERFYQCGDNRDGNGYRDVTKSSEENVVEARKRFDAILASMPKPLPREGAVPKNGAPAQEKASDKKGSIPEASEGKEDKQARDSESSSANDKTRAANFARRDTNQDGKLTWEEFSSRPAGRGDSEAKEKFQKWDIDRDGVLSKKEFVQRTN